MFPGASKPTISTNERLKRLVCSMVTDQVNDQVDDQVLHMIGKILLLVREEPRKRSELLEHLSLSNHSDNVNKYIQPLEAAFLITKTLPNKPQSPKQKYMLTEKGKILLDSALKISE